MFFIYFFFSIFLLENCIVWCVFVACGVGGCIGGWVFGWLAVSVFILVFYIVMSNGSSAFLYFFNFNVWTQRIHLKSHALTQPLNSPTSSLPTTDRAATRLMKLIILCWFLWILVVLSFFLIPFRIVKRIFVVVNNFFSIFIINENNL